MLFLSVILLIFVACLALQWRNSMWTNALAFINIIFAGIIASNFFEPLGWYLEYYMASYTFFMYFLAFWLIFCLSYLVLRMVTDIVSKERVRFRKPVEISGKIGFSVLCSWLMICIFCMSLHFAPVPRTWGGFGASPDSNCILGILAPDRQWLGFMYTRSGGALSTWSPNQFDENAEFIYLHGQRRANYEREVSKPGGSPRVGIKRKKKY